MNAQFKRGIVEMLVLKVVDEKPRSSFDVIDILSQKLTISENTIYPILRRLTSQGYFETTKEATPIGAPRKHYQITKKGKDKLETFQLEWETFLTQVLELLGGKYDA